MYDKTNMVHHNLPEAFSSPVYSKKIDVKLHDSVIFNPCFNHDYDGDAKGPGSEIIIRSKPEIVARKYRPGTPVNPQRLDSRARSVKVGRSWEVSLEIHDWEKMNTDLPGWLELHSYDVAGAAREYMENEWFGEAYAELAASSFANRNAGKNAGEGGNIDLGTVASPVVLSPVDPAHAPAGTKNVVDQFYDMNMVYSQHTGSGKGFKYAIVPLEVCDLMLRFDAFYRSASPAALPELLSADVTKFGAHPVTGFNMLVSKRLKPVGTYQGKRVFPIFFGDSNAWSWVDLGSENGIFQDVDKTPGKDVDYNIGHYDRWLADPRYFGTCFAAV